MRIFRLFAYAVNPQRTVDPAARSAPVGGPIDVDAALHHALDGALRMAQGRLSRVALVLNTDPRSRTSLVRDCVMDIAFAPTTPGAQPSALALASRLSTAMDHRSEPGLFLVAAYREGTATPTRQLAAWVFPRGVGFRFQSRQQRLQLVKDYFDRNSMQRKLALFVGQNAKSQFLQADVLDFQAGGVGDVTDLWVRRFLDAGPSITKDGGTRMLARAFKETSRLKLTGEEREQLQAAIMALRITPQAQWSMEDVASQFLSDDLKQRFVSTAPNDASRRSTFTLDRGLFEATLNFRQFKLENDVVVYSPLGEIGKGVRASPDGDGRSYLEVRGKVVEDKLSQRRG